MLSIRPLTYEDYDETLVGWWAAWGWTAPARDFLPNDGEGGLMVLDGDVPVCAGYMYATNSRVATTHFKISAIAIAKSSAEGKDVVARVLYTDTELLKHYNDAVFYRNRINKTTDMDVVESRMARLDISIARSKVLKENLDKFIF